MRETCQGMNECTCPVKGAGAGLARHYIECELNDPPIHCPGCPTVHPAAVPPGDALPPARLEELERLYGQMTPGPWHAGHFGRTDTACQCRYILDEGHFGGVGEVYVSDGENDAPKAEQAAANLNGIVALVNAFPALLAAARERETLRERLDTAGDQLRALSRVSNDHMGAAIRAEDERDTLRQQLATLTAERDELSRMNAEKAKCVEELTALVFRGADLLSPEERDFLCAKLADAERSVRARESAAESHEWEPTAEEIAAAVAVTRAPRGTPRTTPALRKSAAARERRIAEKYRRDARLYRAIIDRLAPRLPDPSGGES